ncbi:hypothetical protein [Nocardia sp. NPDC004415]
MYVGGKPATVFQPAPLYLWAIIVVAVLMGCAGACAVWVEFTGTHDVPLVPLVAAVVTVPFSILGGGYAATRLVRPRPELVLTAEGLMDRHGVWVGWNEVARVEFAVQSLSGGSKAEWIHVWLHDPASYYAQVPPRARLLSKVRMGVKSGHLNLSPPVLDASAHQILAAFRHYRPNLVID